MIYKVMLAYKQLSSNTMLYWKGMYHYLVQINWSEHLC